MRSSKRLKSVTIGMAKLICRRKKRRGCGGRKRM